MLPALLLVAACDREDAPDPEQRAQLTRTGSVRVDAGGPVPQLPAPSQYRLVYVREELPDKGAARSSTEVHSVRRPFESHVIRSEGRLPGGDPLLERTARLTRSLTRVGRNAANVLGVAPAAAPGDVRLASLLDRAIELGLIERREQRKVLGRRCQVYRTGGSLYEGTLRRAEPGAHADSCVDGAGLVLEEVIVTEALTTRRIAVELEDEADLDDALFEVGEPTAEVRQGGGSARPVDPAAAPLGPFWQLPTPPPGFEHVGRFSVIPPQAEVFGDPTREGELVATVADVWRRGPDMIVVDQGGSLHGVPPYRPDLNAPRRALGELGSAEEHLTAQGPELRVALPQGRFVRVTGTLPVNQLAEVASHLRQVTGTGLVYL